MVKGPESSPLTFSSHVFSSTYKDSNTLHLPTERFSPVRRFSDGAASIQAFKAHLEKLANSSSIKQLQQVMGETAGTSGEAWGTQSNSVEDRGGKPRPCLCQGSDPCSFPTLFAYSLVCTAFPRIKLAQPTRVWVFLLSV